MTPARIAWRHAAITDVLVETPHAKTLILDVPGWPGHLAGQHVDVRLTAQDGYQTQRSYSIASAPIAPNWVKSSGGCGTDGCGRTSATS